jgi:hypothetical protein
VCASYQADKPNQFDAVIFTFIRLFFPIWFAYLMIMVAFRIGVKKRRDRCPPQCLKPPCLALQHAWGPAAGPW